MASPEVRAFAPGRVNLIGEHTDYNGGLSLPFAIASGITVTAAPGTRPGACRVEAVDLSQEDCFSIADPPPARGWRGYVHGTVAELTRLGVELPDADLTISGNLPRGSGLSSSAALEVALSLALLALAGASRPDALTLARLCSRVEHKWLGAHSGLLDQLAVICGQAGRALAIDFRGPEMSSVPLALGAYTLASIDSGQKRRLGASGYNDRRDECRRASELLGVEYLSQATLDEIEDLPEPLRRRARHVVSENARVLETIAALETGDLDAVGELLNASHDSLRDDFEVSTPEVERTVAAAREDGALGARIVGGGFGGSVLALFGPGREAPAGATTLTAADGARLLDGVPAR